MSFTKGGTAGGWIHILKDKQPVALMHPKYVDRFLAVDDLYDTCKMLVSKHGTSRAAVMAVEALAKVEK